MFCHFPENVVQLNKIYFLFSDSSWDKSVSRKLSRDSGLEDLVEAFQDYNQTCPQTKDGILLATTSANVSLNFRISLLKKLEW